MAKRKKESGGLGIHGMFRVKRFDKDTGRVTGDSGWKSNLVTSFGINKILNAIWGNTTVGVDWMCLGSGGTAAFSATELPSAISESQRGDFTSGLTLATAATAYSTLQFLATFYGTDITGTKTITNVGLYGANGVGQGDLWAGKTFAQSTWETNQDIFISYNIMLGGQTGT